MTFQQFNQNYQLKEILGHGTQSTVRRVVRRDTFQVFAAKIYQSFLVKAKHELQMLVRLDHPSIVNVYEVYQQQNCIILILDYMAGGELYDQISQRKRLTEQEVRYQSSYSRHYIRVLIDAVRYCHQMGVAHRDIKPQNILLSTNGPDAVLKLSDFGISKILTDEELNTICGTPIYMAPEIWLMKQYNEKVDIWSIGVVTYYLLSGEYPFSGENTQILLNRICHQQLKFTPSIWDSISTRAQILLRSMLNKDAYKRPNAQQVQNHIWFVQSIPKMIHLEQDPNLFQALVSISRDKIKTKKIKKMKQVNEILSPSRKVPFQRAKFLLSRQDESQTHGSSMSSET